MLKNQESEFNLES